MSFEQGWQLFVEGLTNATWYETVAVIAGIVSVWLGKKENVLVFPIGLINTITFIYISAKAHLYGEASLNLYYTLVSIYGWMLWTRTNKQHQKILHITRSTAREWTFHLLLFAMFYLVVYAALVYLKKDFAPGAIPWADAFASATAYTAMWLMAKKKLESWLWWIATNIASIPLFFVKGYMVTMVQFVFLLVLAFMGYASWRRKAFAQNRN